GNENGVTESQEASHHNVYRNNHIHHFSSRGIWSMHRTHDSIFENNYIHHIDDGNGYETGIDLDGFGNVVWRHIVRNNPIHDVDHVAIALENTFDSIVENNILHDSRKGISVINYGGEVGEGWGTDKRCEVGGENNQYGDTDGDNDCRGDLTGNIIRQNLIHNINIKEGIAIYWAGGVRLLGNTISMIEAAGIYLNSAEYCPQIEIQGNIISGFIRGAINVQSVNSLEKDSNNLIYNPNGHQDYYIADTWYSLSEYQNTTGNGKGSIKANPLFVDPSNNDFYLQSDSLAIDAGVDIGLANDMDGISKPQGLGFDMGVYEYKEPFQIYLPNILAFIR
ncbi:MAG: right-handed parallel beta-helix repeat-containing protein, partial [Anaerolineales bacterium]|nr:right-handed parallel beta-helix repeat-containing protein [Anaerolineales bacterium]